MKSFSSALVGSILLAGVATAAPIRFDYSGTDFFSGDGSTGAPPLATLNVSVSIDYDFASGVGTIDQSSGLTLISSNFVSDTPLVFTYNAVINEVVVGGSGGGSGPDGTAATASGQKDFAILFRIGPSPSASLSAPLFSGGFYDNRTGGSRDRWFARTGQVTSDLDAVVPLPAPMLLYIGAMGLLGTAIARRSRQT